MNFKIGDKVFYLGKKCIIAASKEKPFKLENHPYLTELVPKNDFVLYIFKEYKDGKEIYEGNFDVLENELETQIWE